jgi:hypothetical protein
LDRRHKKTSVDGDRGSPAIGLYPEGNLTAEEYRRFRENLTPEILTIDCNRARFWLHEGFRGRAKQELISASEKSPFRWYRLRRYLCDFNDPDFGSDQE